jgi:hypothetical protein
MRATARPQPAAKRKRVRAAPAAEAVGQATHRDHDQACEQPAAQAGHQRHQQTGQQQRPGHGLHTQATEVGFVAEHGHRDQAGQHDGGDHQRAVRDVAPACQLLQREDDAAQRGVEGRGDAGSGPGHHQVVRIDA